MVERTQRQVSSFASDLQDQGLQAFVEIDRDSAARLGVTTAAITNALYNAYGQRLVSTIFTQSSQYRVVLEVKPEFGHGPAALQDLYVPSTNSTVQGVPAQVPLASVADSPRRRMAAARSSISFAGCWKP